jgi:hypothetical protein
MVPASVPAFDPVLNPVFVPVLLADLIQTRTPGTNEKWEKKLRALQSHQAGNASEPCS